MKNLVILSFVALSSILLWGCPYETSVAIDSAPSVKIDEQLLGVWKVKNDDNNKFIVIKETDNMYRIEEQKKDEDKSSFFHAFLSKVNDATFMNAKEDDGLSDNYYLYKVVVNSPTSVKLIPVTENITEKFSSSAELRKFIEKNMGLSFFYDKVAEEYVKQ